MFIDELKSKFNLKEKMFSYTINVLGGEGVYVSGVKKVLSTSKTEIVLRSTKLFKIVGNSLCIQEIGGGDVSIKGEVSKIEIE